MVDGSAIAFRATVSAGYAEALIGYAVSRGVNRERLAETADLDSSALADPDNRLPLRRFLSLLDAAREATGDPALALRFGAEVQMAEASVAGLIGRFAESLEQAVAMLNRYGRLMVDVPHEGPNRFELIEDDEGHWLVDTRSDPAAWPALSEATFARLVTVARQMFPGRDYHEEVHFAHPAPAHAAAYGEIFRVPVLFSREANRMRFDPAALERRIPTEQPRYALSILGGHADALLATLDSRDGVRRQVEEALALALPEGRADQGEAARRVGLSRRTLHRRLRAEGTTFEQVLDELRRRLAAEHLAAGFSVKRTAHLLGFSDPAAFSRAFKRWTGASPGASRRSGAKLP